MNMHAPDEELVNCTVAGTTLVTEAITFALIKLFNEPGSSGEIWDASGPSVHYASGEVRSSVGSQP